MDFPSPSSNPRATKGGFGSKGGGTGLRQALDTGFALRKLVSRGRWSNHQ
jgi:hypothetical protein